MEESPYYPYPVIEVPDMRKKFDTFLASFHDDDVVGISIHGCQCPVARFFISLGYVVSCTIGSHTSLGRFVESIIIHPEWLRKLVLLTDTYYMFSTPISAHVIRRVMKEVDTSL